MDYAWLNFRDVSRSSVFKSLRCCRYRIQLFVSNQCALLTGKSEREQQSGAVLRRSYRSTEDSRLFALWTVQFTIGGGSTTKCSHRNVSQKNVC